MRGVGLEPATVGLRLPLNTREWIKKGECTHAIYVAKKVGKDGIFEIQ
jgi:hypothetical protein